MAKKPRQLGSKFAPIYRESYCKIVRGRRRRYDRFTVAYYRLDGEKRKRFRRSFASLEDARTESDRISIAIQNGEADVLKLKNVDRSSYLHAIKALAPLKMPLHVAVEEYVAARQEAGGASLVAAAKEYSHRHAGAPGRKEIAEVVKEFLSAKEQDAMSVRYQRSLRSHLNRFSEHFQMPIGTVTAAQIEDWLRGTKRGPRTRKNLRNSIVTLFRFAKARGYLSRTLVTEAEHVERPRDRGGKIGIFRPEQLGRLLVGTEGEPSKLDDQAKLYLAFGGFTGIRTAELIRLEWEDINFARGHVVVAKDRAKTAARRLVPIQPNLMEWLAPYRGRTGRVFSRKHAEEHAIAQVKDAGVQWPNNVLRHSYATYRLPQCSDAARVALEMGNSPATLFRDYRELADEKDAALWFSIVPPAAALNVVQMRARK